MIRYRLKEELLGSSNPMMPLCVAVDDDKGVARDKWCWVYGGQIL